MAAKGTSQVKIELIDAVLSVFGEESEPRGNGVAGSSGFFVDLEGEDCLASWNGEGSSIGAEES